MDDDDELCLCFHVTRRKVVQYIRVHRPTRTSQLSDCYGAGTGWSYSPFSLTIDGIVNVACTSGNDVVDVGGVIPTITGTLTLTIDSLDGTQIYPEQQLVLFTNVGDTTGLPALSLDGSLLIPEFDIVSLSGARRSFDLVLAGARLTEGDIFGDGPRK